MSTNSTAANPFLEEFKRSSITDKFFVALLAVVPFAVIADLLALPPLMIFAVAALAVVPLAKLMSDSTHALAEHAGPAIGGLLAATFGNAVEMIIATIALFKGLDEVVKASITGSIIGNILLVLGLSMFLGGLPRKHQTFNSVSARASASQLTLAAIALIVPAAFTSTLSGNLSTADRGDLLQKLSLVVAVILLICYAGQLVFFLITHTHLSQEQKEHAIDPALIEDGGQAGNLAVTGGQQLAGEPAHAGLWSVKRSLITLFISTVAVGFISEILVGSIEPLTKQLGWTELFVGVVFLAIIGNVAEYVAAISAARRNQMNLSLNIALGSSLQLALFVTPALVFIGLLTGHPLTLRFEEFELVSMVVAILIVNVVTSDGESNWFEGLQLIGAYAIIAVAFFFHP